MSEPNGTIAWRLSSIERRVEHLYALKPEVIAARQEDVLRDIEELRDELRGVRRALWGFGLSVAGGAIIFAFTAFQVWGT